MHTERDASFDIDARAAATSATVNTAGGVESEVIYTYKDRCIYMYLYMYVCIYMYIYMYTSDGINARAAATSAGVNTAGGVEREVCPSPPNPLITGWSLTKQPRLQSKRTSTVPRAMESTCERGTNFSWDILSPTCLINDHVSGELEHRIVSLAPRIQHLGP